VNSFGLYKVPKCPTGDYPHDPDLCLTAHDLQEPVEIPDKIQPNSLPSIPDHGQKEQSQTQSLQSPSEPNQSQFDPFPNQSSFHLGEWWWSNNHEKSRSSFQALLDVVGSDTFNPKDVREANWSAIDKALATSQYEADGLDPNWEDDDGISWACTNITISVPFNTLSIKPGPKNFTIPGFHYRPLVPLIKRKLEGLTACEYFHTFGYELRWHPGAEKEDVRVYGEAYTSPAFLQAYDELQVCWPVAFLYGYGLTV
jgi:hypothetical protein